MTQNKPISFEEAYARLEQILTEMNHSEIALEKSLQLFEEADTLIRLCNSKLKNAEQKVEMLIKNRNGDVMINANGDVETAPIPTMDV